MARWLRGLWLSPLSLKALGAYWALISTLMLYVGTRAIGEGRAPPGTVVAIVVILVAGAFLTLGVMRLSWWAVLASGSLATFLLWSFSRQPHATVVAHWMMIGIAAIPALLVAHSTARHWRAYTWRLVGKTLPQSAPVADVFA